MCTRELPTVGSVGEIVLNPVETGCWREGRDGTYVVGGRNGEAQFQSPRVVGMGFKTME